MRVAALYAYPVKSCGAVALAQASFDVAGLAGDRRFALLDRAGRALTQREAPALARIVPRVAADGLHLDLGGLEQVFYPFEAFRDPLAAQSGPLEAYLGEPVRLVMLPSEARRAFVDAQPVLVVNAASVAALGLPDGLARYRANVVVEEAPALAELGWRRLHGADIELECIEACLRCEVVGQPALRRLAAVADMKFGVYCRVARGGRLRAGEALHAA